MDLLNEVVAAFGGRIRPLVVCGPNGRRCTGDDDALWFAGKDWRALSHRDWTAHPEAIHFLTPEAFRYYLPSILALSIEAPEEWLWPADALLMVLDRSPVPEYWDEFILTRLLGLADSEYAALEKWLLFIAEHASYSHSIDRAFDTIGLLRCHARQPYAAVSQ
ncbi:hypothetical protein [Massilia sp. erpn]|uniref:hypothetical protein n=1 Tax=Massilia sp. erpn TaxID=2738142 RepID=UPI002102D174|nr:hypothetical protein [Massilia sp. erpn]UTY59606.1 hypothetical protein HPQ68_21975 [Massilia sp. erpn]